MTDPTRCASSACIVVRLAGREVVVSGSDDPAAPSIRYDKAWWTQRCVYMRESAKSGRLPSGVAKVNGGYTWTKDNVTLRFSEGEWNEFVTRVRSGRVDVDKLAAVTHG